MGLRPVLIERGEHPRFAIGESSTPQGDLVLAELADRYGLARVAPLCKYGSWRRHYPELVCGLKRGFSYFHHPEGEDFSPRSDHENELLSDRGWSASLQTYLTECLVLVVRKTRLILPIPSDAISSSRGLPWPGNAAPPLAE
jgi:hypothetical protein